MSGPIPVELGDLTELTGLFIDGDTGLCLPTEIQDTEFGRLAIDNNNVPLCGTRGDGLGRRGGGTGGDVYRPGNGVDPRVPTRFAAESREARSR